MKIKASSVLLLIILLIGALVRSWGIQFGLPYSYHFDESTPIYAAFFAAANKLEPHFFLFPMLYPYILIILYEIYFVMGFLLNFWGSPFQFFVAYLKDPTVFLLIGRVFTALTGVATVFLVYWVGKKLYSKEVGLIAAFFLSVTFLHVQESHYIKQDVLTGLFSLLAFYVSVRIARLGKLRDYLLLGLIFGLFASLKYNFFILVPMFLLAHFLREKKLSLSFFINQKFLQAAFISVAVFFILNPYVIFEWNRALPDIITQAQLTTVQWVSSEGQPVWLYYLTYHLRYGLGMPLLLLSGGGIVYVLLRRKREDLLLLATPLAFFATLVLFGGTNFSRYAVMILPHLVLMGAVALKTLVSPFHLLRGSVVLALVAILVMWATFIRVVTFDYYLTRPDTRTLAKSWIEEHIPAGTRIVNEGAVRSEYQSVFGPPLYLDIHPIEKLLREVKEKGLPGNYLKALREANKDKIGYNLLGTLTFDSSFTTSLERFELKGVEQYVDSNHCYLISSNWAKGNREGYKPEFLQSLLSSYEVFKEFMPNPAFGEDLIWRVDFEVLDSINPFAKETVAGSMIKIYKLKGKEKECP